MPKFGMKCFLGSFIFSMVIVILITKGYNLWYIEENLNIDIPTKQSEIKDINLFSVNEESLNSDKIANTDNSINNSNQTASLEQSSEDKNNLPNTFLSENNNKSSTLNNNEYQYDDISDTLNENDKNVFYTGNIEEDSNEQNFASSEFDGKAPSINEGENQNLDSISPKELSDSDDNNQVNANILSAKDELKDDLKIENKENFAGFKIPFTKLKSDDNKFTSSKDTAIKSMSLASQNLGLKSDFDINASNQKTAQNSQIEEYSKTNKSDIAALDKNNFALAKSDKETQTAYKMQNNVMPDNIIIPIPEDRINDRNNPPELSVSPENKKIEEKVKKEEGFTDSTASVTESNTSVSSAIKNDVTNNVENNKAEKSLGDSIAKWFSSSQQKNESDNVTPIDNQNLSNNSDDDKNSYVSSIKKSLGIGDSNKKKDAKKTNKKIAPSELKLSFQPNRAEISGQTLEWLHAFAQNALENEGVSIEIRIDGSNSFELQQKRLNLLYSIFANNGVNYKKINVIFTSREQNSFIIRNVKYLSEEGYDESDNMY